jgi:trimeric autotransporter adhesin
MQFSRPLKTGPMPIAPSAVSISGAAAPAVGETNTSMPASAQGTVDANALFAQLLGVSLASIDEAAQVPASESAPLSASQTTNLAAPQTTAAQSATVGASQSASTESTQPGTSVSALPVGEKITPLPSFLIGSTLAKFIEAAARSPRSSVISTPNSSLQAIDTENASADADETVVEGEPSRDSADSATSATQLFPSSSTSSTASAAKTPVPAIATWPSPTVDASLPSKTIFSSVDNRITPKQSLSQNRQMSSSQSLASNIPLASPVVSPSNADANIANTFAVSIPAAPGDPRVDAPLVATSSSVTNESASASAQTMLTGDIPPGAGTAMSTDLPASPASQAAADAASTAVLGSPVAPNLESAPEPTTADATALAASSYSSLTDRSVSLQFISRPNETSSSPAQVNATRGVTAANSTSQAAPDPQPHPVAFSTDASGKIQSNLSPTLNAQQPISPSMPEQSTQVKAQGSSQLAALAAGGAANDSVAHSTASPLNFAPSHVVAMPPTPESASAVSAAAHAQDPLKVTHAVAVSVDPVAAHAPAPQQTSPSFASRVDTVRSVAPLQSAAANADSSGSGTGTSTSTGDDTADDFSPISAGDASASQSASADAESGAPSFDAQSNAASSMSSTDPQAQTNPRVAHTDVLASAQPTSSTSVTLDSSEPSQIATAVTSAARVDANSTEASSPAARTGATETPLATAVRTDRASEAVDSSALLRAWNGGDNAQTHLVQSAQVGGNVRESQVNIALQADTLGNVEVHARVAGDVVGASIGVDRHDAHAMISSTLPTLHEALTERQLRVSEVSVFQNSQQQASSAPGDGRTAQQRDPGQQRSAANPWTAEQTASLPDAAIFGDSSSAASSFDSNGRLSVRA